MSPPHARDPGPAGAAPCAPIALLISDIDGTLVTPSKTLTPGARAAVGRLADAGIAFTLVSSRPPRGMAALVDELGVRLPFGAFNGGSLVAPDLSLITARRLAPDIARRVLALLAAGGVETWIFADGDWLVRDAGGANVARERRALGFAPKVTDGLAGAIGRIDKIVGVSDDLARLRRVEIEARRLVGAAAAIKVSQPGHLDVTHPQAEKGAAVAAISHGAGIDLRNTATIGDSFNDVPMFARAGFSVAMGQAPAEVRARASAVTLSNAEDGFARAVERLVLPYAAVAGP
jgi:Cof subfamily protein (haloacid dehalogenase superfamily)